MTADLSSIPDINHDHTNSSTRGKEPVTKVSANDLDNEFENIDYILSTSSSGEQRTIMEQTLSTDGVRLHSMDAPDLVAASCPVIETVHAQDTAQQLIPIPTARPGLAKRKRAIDDCYAPEAELPQLPPLQSTLTPVVGQTAATAILLSSDI